MEKGILFSLIILLIFIQSGCTKKETTDTKTSTLTSTTAELTTTTEDHIDPREFVITHFMTTGTKSKLLEEQENTVLKYQNDLTATTKIIVDPTVVYQEMDGFGAALTESSAYLINQLESEKRDAVIRDLFSKEGIGINFIRLPMGASDFALNNYSYNDMELGTEDLDLSEFSIERDKENVIPVLKSAFQLNNDIKLLGSPWSAPAWMKDNGSLNGGSLQDKYIDVYGNYFLKFIQEYDKEGLPIYALTLQNEPLHETSGYPTMKMSANQQIKLVKNLGPKLESNHIETKIITYDHNWDVRSYTFTVLNDQIANQYVAGTAFHCYAGSVDSQSIVNRAFPDKGIWFTECSGGKWATNFADNISWNMENVFIGSINNYSKSVLLWNIALDQNDGPKNGGCQNCRGVITINPDGSIIKNEEYYMIGHFAKFVEPGAKRIGTSLTGNSNILNTAFLNPNGDIVIVLHNKSSMQSTVLIEYDGLTTKLTIPSQTTSTLIINKSS